MMLSITEISNLSGFDRRRIRSLLADIQATKGTRGAITYESREALPRLYARESGDYDLTAERGRLTFHLANKAALEAKHLEGSLVAVEDVAETVGNEYANVRARLLGIPTRAAPMVVGLSTVAIRTKLDDLIRECLEELTADDPRRHSL